MKKLLGALAVALVVVSLALYWPVVEVGRQAYTAGPYEDVPGFCYGLCVDSGVITGKAAAEYAKAG